MVTVYSASDMQRTSVSIQFFLRAAMTKERSPAAVFRNTLNTPSAQLHSAGLQAPGRGQHCLQPAGVSHVVASLCRVLVLVGDLLLLQGFWPVGWPHPPPPLSPSPPSQCCNLSSQPWPWKHCHDSGLSESEATAPSRATKETVSATDKN